MPRTDEPPATVLPTLDGVVRQLLREVVREVVREELAATPQAAPAPVASEPDLQLQLLTTAQVAAELRVTAKTVRGWIDSGQLRARSLGPRLVRIERTELGRFVAAGAPAASRVEIDRLAARLLGRQKP